MTKIKINEIIDLINSYIKYIHHKIRKYYFFIINACKNLEEANSKILIKKIQNFETKEAFNRIRLMRLLWPNNEQAAFFMCLIHMINGDLMKARIIIDKFIKNAKTYKFDNLSRIIEDNPKDIEDLFYGGLNLLEISEVYNESF